MARTCTCRECGEEIQMLPSPRTGRKIRFNLDGSEHWATCSIEKQEAYAQHKRKAKRAAIELKRGFERGAFG